METGMRRDIPTFVIVLFCIGAIVYLALFWKLLVLLSLLVFGFYFVFRGASITWKEGLTVFGLIVYVGLMVTPLAKVWQLYKPKKPREVVLQPPYRNLDRELRLFAASSATNSWMSTKLARPSESLGMKHSAALGLRGRVYEGKYPTQMEAVKLIKAGKFAVADDLVSLSDQVVVWLGCLRSSSYL